MTDQPAGAVQHQRRRADAERSRSAVLAAAAQVLGTRPDAGLDAVAKAAGLSRQTVYAHFSSREALIDAVVDHVTAELVAAMDAVPSDGESAEAVLLRLLDACRQATDRQPLLRQGLPVTPERSRELHRPIVQRFTDVIVRGQRSGEFSDRLPPSWLVASIIALAHAAGEEIEAGRITPDAAESALRTSLLRLVRPY